MLRRSEPAERRRVLPQRAPREAYSSMLILAYAWVSQKQAPSLAMAKEGALKS
jgi:hypothetical protein